jgi:hypothetical protein
VTRRLFYVAFGAAAGVLIVRRLTEVANKWTPEGIANQAGGVGDKLSLWWAEVQHHAAEREAELREALGLDSAESGD